MARGARRQAVNYAINREDLIRYATKGNGVIIPALMPKRAFGYDPDLAPYPFDRAKRSNCGARRAIPWTAARPDCY